MSDYEQEAGICVSDEEADLIFRGMAEAQARPAVGGNDQEALEHIADLQRQWEQIPMTVQPGDSVVFASPYGHGVVVTFYDPSQTPKTRIA